MLIELLILGYLPLSIFRKMVKYINYSLAD